MPINPVTQAHQRKINNMLSRGVINSSTMDNGYLTAQAKLMNNEVQDALEHYQEFGHVSIPPPGSEFVAMFFGGNRDHGHILKAVNKSMVPTTLLPGESGMHSSFPGTLFYVDVNGTIHLVTPGGNISLDAAGGLVMNITSWTINGTVFPFPP